LAQSLAAAWHNTIRCSREHNEHYAALVELDALFRTLIEHADDGAQRLAGAMLMRAHGSFLAAASLALGGQVAESYVVMRNVLHSALQGVYVAGDAERQRVWLGRSDDDQAEERMRMLFADDQMFAHLSEIDAATAAIFQRLEKRTIVRGEHPNAVASVGQNGRRPAAPVDASRAHLATDFKIQQMALRTAAQVGICALTLFYYVYGDQFREHGLDARLTKLRQGH
jgi:hypothetical protein